MSQRHTAGIRPHAPNHKSFRTKQLLQAGDQNGDPPPIIHYQVANVRAASATRGGKVPIPGKKDFITSKMASLAILRREGCVDASFVVFSTPSPFSRPSFRNRPMGVCYLACVARYFSSLRLKCVAGFFCLQIASTTEVQLTSSYLICYFLYHNFLLRSSTRRRFCAQRSAGQSRVVTGKCRPSPPPGTCLHFLSRMGFSVPIARRFSSHQCIQKITTAYQLDRKERERGKDRWKGGVKEGK